MPNHIHGIIIVGATRRVARTDDNTSARTDNHKTIQSGSLGAIIGQFKSIAAKRINATRKTPGDFIWQRNYYDHIIRGDADLNRAREYIVNNPLQWALDDENPANARAPRPGGVKPP